VRNGEGALLHLGRSQAGRAEGKFPRARACRVRSEGDLEIAIPRAAAKRTSESEWRKLATCIRARWSAERATPAGCRRGASWQVRYV